MECKSCPFCQEDIKVGAIKCKHCGSMLVDISHGQTLNGPKETGTLWLPVPSMVIGIICLLALFDDSGWDVDMLTGLFFMGIVSLVLGIVSVAIQQAGKGMAIAGIVLSSLSLLAGIGLLIE
ncbi:MAG: DUF4190 domain-containing protein [Pseudomonas sp.]|nr:DUF4190 domain-containing protein [Pseudomonas sp.]